jgi:hypothetical protein
MKKPCRTLLGIRRGVSNGEEDGHRPPNPQGIEGSSMVGSGETLGSPWLPLDILLHCCTLWVFHNASPSCLLFRASAPNGFMPYVPYQFMSNMPYMDRPIQPFLSVCSSICFFICQSVMHNHSFYHQLYLDFCDIRY